MRFSLRLMLPVIVCIALVSGLFAYYQEQEQERALHKELDQRASLAAQNLADALQPLLEKNSSATELRKALGLVKPYPAGLTAAAGSGPQVVPPASGAMPKAAPVMAPRGR